MTELRLFNSLTRQIEPFVPVHPGEARVYTCGPTVYNYPHIGNMRAYVFADTLGRVLSYKGYKLTHVINITDVGHLTDDADAGEDKMEKMAAENAQSIWDIAKHYTEAYWADVKALNIRKPAHWSIATDYVPEMIAFATSIADKHCYEINGGLYFDVSTVADYGHLAGVARAHQISEQLDAKEILTHQLDTTKDINERVSIVAEIIYDTLAESEFGRIETVESKRNAADFAIWRTTPADETRQMEWDSPWGKGAPGWHLECSVMSEALLGLPFDIHTGGIDHREIHHPNEIAQNQARCHSDASGANIWMHNNFLIDRTGKMSKSSGEFLRLQLLIDKGFHPLAYRLMCLQAHYRSELEFSWDYLFGTLTRLKRMIGSIERVRNLLPQETKQPTSALAIDAHHPAIGGFVEAFESAISNDLNSSSALVLLDAFISTKDLAPSLQFATIKVADNVLGLELLALSRTDLRIRPKAAVITEAEIEAALAARKDARAAKDFAKSDTIRDDLIAKGVEVMDGDPLEWDWKLDV